MRFNSFWKKLPLLLLTISFGCQKTQQVRPNVIIIYADDLGYVDVSFNGSKTINTPNLDKLANQGVRFTNGYATSATCTPSRYALLTGDYPWRRKDAKILPGTAPLIIDTAQMTLPKMLKKRGYHTAVIGKWHLGLGSGSVNWNKKISPGPNQVGFDYSFIMAATQDRVPTVFIRNGNVVGMESDDPIEVRYDQNYEGQPTGKENPELLKMMWHHGHNGTIVNGIPRIGFMKGGEKAKWVDEDMSDSFLDEVKSYVQQKKDQPFFLYYALQQPHVPRTPHPRFKGKSGMGPRGDAIMEADWSVGELVQLLEQEKLLENTIIIFSSDNGPVLNDGYYDQAEELVGNHQPSGALRGGKYSLFEAGTRVPFFVYWKGKTDPIVSHALVCQMDLMASLAQLMDIEITSEDSQPMMNVFLGKEKNGRKSLILEANTRTALRSDDWVMIPPYPGVAINTEVNIELGNLEGYGLYNIAQDVSQSNNLSASNPEKLKEMIAEFEAIRGADYQKIEQLELK
ncbi:MAG: arylsulfatase [Cyclobacteriaceae bacterium]